MPGRKDGVTGGKSSLPEASAGARRSMRIAGIIGPTCAVLCIVLGVLDVSQGHGILLLTTGFVSSVFWLLIVPSARRGGKL